MNQILYSRKKQKTAQRIAITLGVLFMLAIVVSVIFYIININNDKILKGVYINLKMASYTRSQINNFILILPHFCRWQIRSGLLRNILLTGQAVTSKS